MTAQPASSHKWNANCTFGNEALVNMPDHGSVVAAVIAGWSVIEATLGRTFAMLIGARQPVSMSMYGAARSFEIQRELLQVAVNEVMSKRHAALIAATLVVVNRSAIHRHRFAHWVWGASADPELRALLLVEPRNYWNLTAAQMKYWRTHVKRVLEKNGPTAFNAGMPQLAHDHIFVYRLKDLNDVRAQIERAYQMADALFELVDSKGHRRRMILHWLNSQADIRLALEKAKNGPQPKS
jgi:hypothetical protein